MLSTSTASSKSTLAPQRPLLSSQQEEPSAPKTSMSYKISNLNAKFQEVGIDLQTIFTYEKRIIMLEVIAETFKFFIYIPSKYEMHIDNAFRLLGIATYELNDEPSDSSLDEPDTLFYSKLPIETLRRKKMSMTKSLHRFLPLVSESPVKLLYIDEYFISYITRHNDVDSLISLSPYNKEKGYFYIIDLEFFYKNVSKLSSEFSKFEKALNKVVYDKLAVEVEGTKKSIDKAQKMLVAVNPIKEQIEFSQRVDELNKFYLVDKHKEKARTNLIGLRSLNLNKIFDFENITYMMKEFK